MLAQNFNPFFLLPRISDCEFPDCVRGPFGLVGQDHLHGAVVLGAADPGWPVGVSLQLEQRGKTYYILYIAFFRRFTNVLGEVLGVLFCSPKLANRTPNPR